MLGSGRTAPGTGVCSQRSSGHCKEDGGDCLCNWGRARKPWPGRPPPAHTPEVLAPGGLTVRWQWRWERASRQRAWLKQRREEEVRVSSLSGGTIRACVCPPQPCGHQGWPPTCLSCSPWGAQHPAPGTLGKEAGASPYALGLCDSWDPPIPLRTSVTSQSLSSPLCLPLPPASLNFLRDLKHSQQSATPGVYTVSPAWKPSPSSGSCSELSRGSSSSGPTLTPTH